MVLSEQIQHLLEGCDVLSSYGHLGQQQVLVAVEPSESEPFEQELAAGRQAEQQVLAGRQEQLEQEQQHIRTELRSHKQEQQHSRMIRRSHYRSPSKHSRCRIRHS